MRHYLFKFKLLSILTIFFTIIHSVLAVIMAFVVGHIIDVATTGKLKDLKNLIIFTVTYLITFFVIGYIKRFFRAKYIKSIIYSLKNDIFNSLLKRNIRNFNKNNSAAYISTLTNDINIIEQDYFENLLDILSNIVCCILATIATAKINLYITFGIFAFGFLPMLIPMIFSKKISYLKKNYSDNLGKFTIRIKDIFSGFQVIKSFRLEDRINADYKKVNYNTENSKCKFSILNSGVNMLSYASAWGLQFFTLILGTYFVLKGSLTIAYLLTLAQLLNNVVNPIVDISSSVTRLKSVKLISKKINTIINENNEEKGSISKKTFDKNIMLKNVEFKYNNDKQILNGISFNFIKGKKYVLVGNSGSGKSTILNLILNYYEDFKGSITIDGIDNREIKSTDLYSLISVIQQNVFMFDDSIKSNITLFENYSDEEIEQAIKLSGLESLINSLPNKINSLVGENGCNLSGGEKQRIAIARAIIKKTPILILDEATSSLDNENSYNIEKSILNLENITCIIVTHKFIPSILEKYDCIVAVKNGLIEEMGTFNELIKNKGYFYSLYTLGSS